MFAARFRENAARALLLPRRQPGRRTPLWMQRKRAADLLAVALRFRNFPIVLETYRECLRDVFDLPALTDLLRQIADRRIRVREVETRSASPYAAALVFSWVGKFLYDDDQPRAERRAQALALDHAQLRELLGDAELRELLDREAIAEVELLLQRLDPRRAIHDLDQLHDALRELGELSRDEVVARVREDLREQAPEWIAALIHQRRAIEVPIADQLRLIAAEDAGRYRDALGVVPPHGLPLVFLELVERPLEELLARYARTHVPFTSAELATRLGLGLGPVELGLERLLGEGRLLEGEFMPGGREREWCDVEILRRLKRASLAKLTAQVEAVEPRLYARFLPGWHRIDQPGEGFDDLLGAIEQLQGSAILASALERAVLPARMSSTIIRASSTPCVRPASWSGSGSSRSATTTAGSPSICPSTTRSWPRHRGSSRPSPSSTSGSASCSGGAARCSSPSSSASSVVFAASCSAACGIWSGPASSATTP